MRTIYSQSQHKHHTPDKSQSRSRRQISSLRLAGLLLSGLWLLGCANQPQLPAQTNAPVRQSAEPLGLLILKDRTLEVAPADFEYSGAATFVWPDGKRQEGTFKQGKLHGTGTEKFAGAIYHGNWENGLRHGQGQLTLPDKTVYMGGWQAGLKSGFGLLRGSSGETYEGEWQEDQKHGFGASTDHNNTVYEGSWQADAKSGYGEMRFANQVIYTGMFKHDHRHGFGKETRPDQSFYEGAWQDGKKHGKGIESYADGSRHEGNWQAGQILGPGTRTNRAGIAFSGPWTRNIISTGLVALPDGAQYAGPLFEQRGRRVREEFLSWLQTQQSPYAHYFLGAAYMDFESPTADVPTATAWFERAAAADLAEAQYRLALIRRTNDPQASLALLQQAASSGHGSAAALLGEFYHIGLYVQKNLATAKALYEQAAKRGSLTATNNLAWLLATTLSELADPQAAVAMIQPLVVYLGNWQHLDTLAAAHARLGNMDLAIELQDQALLRASNQAQQTEDVSDSASLSDTMVEMENRLHAYKDSVPYTE